MRRYVALLRGINVGGNNIIRMKELAFEFERLGFTKVMTYINSGNVIFESGIGDSAKIEDLLEEEISSAFGYKIRVFVRDAEEIKETVRCFPEIFKDDDWRHNIIFLSKRIDADDILDRFEIKSPIEEVHHARGILYWSAKKDQITKTKMIRLASRSEYKEMTIRGVNTTIKLSQLLSTRDDDA